MRNWPHLLIRIMLLISILSTIIYGCLGANRQASSIKIDEINKIAVIPMESPPLEISPEVSTEYLFGTSAVLATAPSQTLKTAGTVGVLVSGIFMLMELPEARKRSEKIAESIETKLDRGEGWIPTAVFSREAAKQITEQKNYDVVLIENVQKFHDLVERRRTASMQNWLKSIRNWYNSETYQSNYKLLKDQKIDTVLEVGVYNYGIVFKDKIGLGVLLKLVDPMTGQVLGRARAYEFQQQETKEIMYNDAQKFKDVFSKLGAQLVAENLKSIGLVKQY